MEIRGREIKFLRTVKATVDISEICPDKDISNLPALLGGTIDLSVKAGAKLIHVLNEGYEMNKHFDDPQYKPRIITEEEIMYLDNKTYNELLESAFASINNGAETTIEVEEPKKKEKEEVAD